MCDAISLAVAGFGLSMAGSASQASQTSKMNQRRLKEAARNQEFITEQENYASLARGMKNIQEIQRLSNATAEVTRQAQQSIGKLSVDIAESGVKGKSMDQLINDFRVQQGREMAGIDYNINMARHGAELESKATGINSRLAGAQAQMIGGPTALSAITGALSSSISMYTMAKSAGIGGGSTPSNASVNPGATGIPGFTGTGGHSGGSFGVTF